jgi:hypothetical protein
MKEMLLYSVVSNQNEKAYHDNLPFLLVYTHTDVYMHASVYLHMCIYTYTNLYIIIFTRRFDKSGNECDEN